MAKKKKSKLTASKQIVIVAVVLILAQGAYLMLVETEPPLGAKQAIDKEIRKLTNVDSRRKEQLRVQLAVQDYLSRNQGKPPESLEKLRPTYFTTIPIDSKTGKPFSYKIVNGRPIIGLIEGEKPQTAAGSAEGSVPVSQLEPIVFQYDPTGKRDPFRPFDFAPKIDTEGKTPLEQYDIGQLKLTAVIKGLDGEPQANIENSARKGFIVRKGTKIGLHGGEVIEVQPDRIMILETTVDFTGEKKTRTIELTLRTKDQDDKKKRLQGQ